MTLRFSLHTPSEGGLTTFPGALHIPISTGGRASAWHGEVSVSGTMNTEMDVLRVSGGRGVSLFT